MGQRFYGRGWNMLRIDETRGALCRRTGRSKQATETVLRKLKLLDEWADHFHLSTCLNEVIDWIENTAAVSPLFIMSL